MKIMKNEKIKIITKLFLLKIKLITNQNVYLRDLRDFFAFLVLTFFPS